MNENTLKGADNLKLICVAATGYDNIDIKYCANMGIQVSNVVGYSTNSVAQVTVATVLELATHLREYNSAVISGKYTSSGLANMVAPIFHELSGKTWGVVGLGNIGKKVAEIAKAFGCRIIANKRTPEEGYECVSLDTLCRQSDIISIHTPLTAETRSLIGKHELELMKKDVILYNAARGAVTDEYAVAEAILAGEIGAFGCDVFSEEPLQKDSPIFGIASLPNVCLTPHMAWASSEARNRCLDEMIENIKAFENGTRRNAVN
jgi:glycerate dehydrogenase